MINKRLRRALEFKAPPLNDREIRECIMWLLKGAEHRAKRFSIPYTLTLEWALERYTGCCELSGMPFDIYKPGRGRSMYAMSLDQIKPRGGYTPDNCRFILWSLNMMLGNCGDDRELIKIARSIVNKNS